MQEKIITYRSLIVLIAIAITLVSLLAFPNLKVNSNLDAYDSK